MFQDFEENSEELGVKSFGVSMTTLEEVFLKIGEEEEAEEENKENGERERNYNIAVNCNTVILRL